MSRTIRRKKAKKHHSNFESEFTFERVDTWLDTSYMAWLSAPKQKLTGKAFDKAYHRYHSDRNIGYGSGTRYHGTAEDTCRSRNKTELIRWKKNEDYDVVIHFPADVSWW